MILESLIHASMTESLRKRILLTADELFKDRGVRDVSIDDICRQLCISKKTFYLYYPQKEDLVGDIIELQRKKREEYFSNLVEGKNSIEIIRTILTELDRKKIESWGTKKLVEDVKRFYPETFAMHIDNKAKTIEELFKSFVKGGLDEGWFREGVDWEAFMLEMCLLHDANSSFIEGKIPMGPHKCSGKALSKVFREMFLHTILTPKGWEEYNRLENK